MKFGVIKDLRNTSPVESETIGEVSGARQSVQQAGQTARRSVRPAVRRLVATGSYNWATGVST